MSADLKIMRLNKEGINPEFQKDIKEYYMVINSYNDELEVTAVPEDENAKVTILGNTNLKLGLNIIEIQVKNEEKQEKYKIYVTKTENVQIANSNLENLAVREGMLTPAFDANVTHYELEVANEISEIAILAIPQKIDARVSVEGNSDLKVGDNTVLITVTAEDGITIKKYLINVHRRTEEEDVENQEEQEYQAQQLQAILSNEQQSNLQYERQVATIQIEESKFQIQDILTFVLLGAVIAGFVIAFVVNKVKKNK